MKLMPKNPLSRLVMVGICLFCVGCVSVISGLVGWDYYNHSSAFIPEEGLVGIDASSAKIIHTLYFYAFGGNDALGSTAVRIYRGKTPDGQSTVRAFITENPDNPKAPTVYLGPLKRQLGDAPLLTTMLETKNVRFVIGYADGTITGTPQLVWFEGGKKGRSEYKNKTSYIDKERIFYIVIYAYEFNEWEYMRSITIDTVETGRERDRKNTLGGYVWDKDFDPHIEIQQLFIKVSLPANSK